MSKNIKYIKLKGDVMLREILEELINEKTVKVGDRVFTKNDSEIYAWVDKIKNGQVEVSYRDDDDIEHITILNISMFKTFSAGFWSIPKRVLN